MNKPVGIDYALMAAIALAWGSQFVFNALAIESFHPLTVAAGRVFIGFITLYLAVLLILKESVATPATINKQPWGLYCGIALAEAILPCFLIPWGQQHVDSSIAAILLATVPIFTLLLAPMFVKEEKLTLMATSSAIIGFIGVVVLVIPNIKGNPLADVMGELAILGGALSFSLSLIMMKRLPDVSPVVAMRNVFGIAAIPLVIFAWILDKPWTVRIEASSLLALLALGVFCGGLAYVMFIYLVQRTGPTFTALVGYLITLVGVFIGIVFMGDKLHMNDLIALALIIVALTIGKLKKS